MYRSSTPAIRLNPAALRAWMPMASAAVSLVVPLIFVTSVSGIDVATGSLGANIRALHDPLGMNLTGTGVRLGQVEPGRPGDPNNPAGGPAEINHPDINPGGAAIGVTNVRRVAGVPTAVSPPPSGVDLSDHATMVAGMMVSTNAARRGSAYNATLFSGADGVATAVDQTDSIAATEWVRGNRTPIINFSFYWPLQNTMYPGGAGAVRDGRSIFARYVDYTARTEDVLFTQAGPEDTRRIGTPWDAYNNVVVSYTTPGAGGRYDRVDPGSNQNVVIPDGGAAATRNKIDMCAPGRIANAATIDLNNDKTLGDTGFRATAGTSFAAPLVAGTAALLQQYATANGLPTGHLRQKVVLLNSASKHVLDRGGAAWPAAREARTDAVSLDPDTGVGQLNGVAAVRQYVAAGRVDRGLRQQNLAGGADASFDLNVPGDYLVKGSLVSATITWDRVVTNTGAGANPLITVANYASSAPTDLNLELVNVAIGAVVARANSAVDNVEHVYFNVRDDARYRLRVRNAGGAAADFAVAWNAGGVVDGLAFGVRPGAVGVASDDRANDVNALGTAGTANFRTESEIFVGSASGSNMLRLSGALQTRSRVGPFNGPPAAISLLDGGQRGVLGLRAGETLATTDQLGDFSWGTDGTADLVTVGEPDVAQRASTLIFSTRGADEIRASAALAPFGGHYSSNTASPAATGTSSIFTSGSALGLTTTDDIDAIELDSPIRDGVGAFPATAVDPDGDGMQNQPVFFTLGAGSPSLGGVRSADDVFVSLGQDPSASFDLAGPAGGFTFQVFADGVKLGLAPGDILDALALSDVNRNGTLDAGDTALFSVAAGGVSGLDGGDVYFTSFDNAHSLFASAADLGIAGSDLDALDVLTAVPEPSTIAIFAVAALAVRRRRRTVI